MSRILSVEEVKQAGKFAWDEFMTLYLPDVGFVGFASPGKAPTEDSEAPQFVPHPSYMLRESGWHHLDGCDCEFCRR